MTTAELLKETIRIQNEKQKPAPEKQEDKTVDELMRMFGMKK